MIFGFFVAFCGMRRELDVVSLDALEETRFGITAGASAREQADTFARTHNDLMDLRSIMVLG